MYLGCYIAIVYKKVILGQFPTSHFFLWENGQGQSPPRQDLISRVRKFGINECCKLSDENSEVYFGNICFQS